MRVGVIGLGKLGLSVALALEQAGHDIAGYEINENRREEVLWHDVPEQVYEPHVFDYLQHSRLRCYTYESLRPLIAWKPDIILVCVQTPHDPDFEGVTPLTREPQDFDYSFLRAAVSEIAATGTDALVVIVSTCLPGTFDREIRPLAGDIRIAYHPLFIAMGSVIEDFRNPEFLLFGRDDAHPGYIGRELCQMYGPVLKHGMGDAGGVPIRCMSITSAELTKVAYNAAIGYKLMLANGIAELSDKVGANCDDVMDTLKLADKRIVSTAYMTPGMGDGGGCHPRDQIALSWLADTRGCHDNPFRRIVDAREAHADWLAWEWWVASDLPMVMLGTAYKPNTPLDTGSHARLVLHFAQLNAAVSATDEPLDTYPVACYFLACPHDWVLAAELPTGSVVVDPWGVLPEREGVEVVRPGRRA